MERRQLANIRDADDRLSAALKAAIDAAAARLAPSLATANTGTYLRAMRAIARAFGVDGPTSITDSAVLKTLSDRALVSATSIATTQASRMKLLVAEFGSRAEAQKPFNQFARQQRAMIATYESGVTNHQALADFHENNPQLTGSEHLEPTTAAVDDECQEAIDMGNVSLGTLSPPYHQNCPHYVEREYDMPDDAGSLWFGGS